MTFVIIPAWELLDAGVEILSAHKI